MSSLVDYLDKGASLGRDAPCLVEGGRPRSPTATCRTSAGRVAGALAARRASQPGGKVGILSSNDATAFACVFGIARRGAVWCPINPRNEAAENRALLELFDCECLLFYCNYADMVAQIAEQLRRCAPSVCLDQDDDFGALARGRRRRIEQADPPGDLAMLVGTGGTTGLPKGVMLTARNLETMTALTLMGYPFDGAPGVPRARAADHAAGVLCFPVLALGGRIVVMRAPDLGRFLALVEQRADHAHVPRRRH